MAPTRLRARSQPSPLTCASSFLLVLEVAWTVARRKPFAYVLARLSCICQFVLPSYAVVQSMMYNVGQPVPGPTCRQALLPDAVHIRFAALQPDKIEDDESETGPRKWWSLVVQ